MRSPIRVPLRGSGRALFLVGLLTALSACAEAPEGWLLEPPLPPTLAEIDPDVTARIEAAAQAVRATPEPADVWADLGKTYEVVGLRTQALACYEQAQLRAPDDPKLFYRSGVCRGRMQDMAGAIRDMDRVIELDPSYAPAHYRRGSTALDDGNLELARVSFEEATRVGPEFMGGWVGLARLHLYLDEEARAIELLEEQFERDPRDPTVAQLLDTAYRQSGSERRVSVPTALAEDEEPAGRFWIDPWQVELRKYRRAPDSQRNARLLERGKADQVIASLEARRAADPRDTSFFAQLVEAYLLEAREEDALRTTREWIELEPRDVPARLTLARLFEAQGEPELAVQTLDEVIELDPDFGPAWAAKGALMVKGEQYEPALEVLLRAVQLDQRNTAIFHDLAKAQMFAKEWAGAEESFARYLEDAPEDAKAHLSLAKVLAKRHQVERAQEELARARELGIDMPGRIAEVERLIERAVERAAKKRRREQAE